MQWVNAWVQLLQGVHAWVLQTQWVKSLGVSSAPWTCCPGLHMADGKKLEDGWKPCRSLVVPGSQASDVSMIVKNCCWPGVGPTQHGSCWCP